MLAQCFSNYLLGPTFKKQNRDSQECTHSEGEFYFLTFVSLTCVYLYIYLLDENYIQKVESYLSKLMWKSVSHTGC